MHVHLLAFAGTTQNIHTSLSVLEMKALGQDILALVGHSVERREDV